MATPINVDHHDDMEIADAASTDMDFDIDFDTTGEAHYTNEDEMQDDVPQTTEPEDIELRSATADPEDYMVDDSVQEISENQDGEMIDDPQDIQPGEVVDEELLDFSDEELDSTPHIQIQQEESHDGITPAVAQDETIHAHHSPALVENMPALEFHAPEATATVEGDGGAADLTAPNEEILSHEKSAESVGQVALSKTDSNAVEKDKSITEASVSNEEHVVFTQVEAQSSTDVDHPNTAGTEAHESAGGNEEDHREEESFQPEELTLENEANEQFAGVIADEIHADEAVQHVAAENDSPRSHSSEGKHTYTGLHTTIVKYAGGEYTLFPSSEPSEGEEYFLQNENLASGSIGDLLQACRGTLGEAITEDEELELHVEDLGLYLSEVSQRSSKCTFSTNEEQDSTAAFSTSFSELLDIFVQLHRQDGNEQPPPVTVSLTSKPRFINRLTLLANAAAEGRGLSQIAFLSPQAEGEYSYDEEHHTEHAASELVEGDDNTNDKQFQHERLEDYGQDHERASYPPRDPVNDEPGEEQVSGDAAEQRDDNVTSRTLSPNHGEVHDVSNDQRQDQDEQYNQEQELFEDDGDRSGLSAQIPGEDREHDKPLDENVDSVTNKRPDYGEQIDQAVQQLEEAAEDFGESLDEAAANPVDAPSEAAITDAKSHEHNSEPVEQHADEFDEIDFEDHDYDNDKIRLNEDPDDASAGKDDAKQANKRGFAEVAEEEQQENKRPRSS